MVYIDLWVAYVDCTVTKLTPNNIFWVAAEDISWKLRENISQMNSQASTSINLINQKYCLG